MLQTFHYVIYITVWVHNLNHDIMKLNRIRHFFKGYKYKYNFMI